MVKKQKEIIDLLDDIRDQSKFVHNDKLDGACGGKLFLSILRLKSTSAFSRFRIPFTVLCSLLIEKLTGLQNNQINISKK